MAQKRYLSPSHKLKIYSADSSDLGGKIKFVAGRISDTDAVDLHASKFKAFGGVQYDVNENRNGNSTIGQGATNPDQAQQLNTGTGLVELKPRQNEPIWRFSANPNYKYMTSTSKRFSAEINELGGIFAGKTLNSTADLFAHGLDYDFNGRTGNFASATQMGSSQYYDFIEAASSYTHSFPDSDSSGLPGDLYSLMTPTSFSEYYINDMKSGLESDGRISLAGAKSHTRSGRTKLKTNYQMPIGTSRMSAYTAATTENSINMSYFQGKSLLQRSRLDDSGSNYADSVLSLATDSREMNKPAYGNSNYWQSQGFNSNSDFLTSVDSSSASLAINAGEYGLLQTRDLRLNENPTIDGDPYKFEYTTITGQLDVLSGTGSVSAFATEIEELIASMAGETLFRNQVETTHDRLNPRLGSSLFTNVELGRGTGLLPYSPIKEPFEISGQIGIIRPTRALKFSSNDYSNNKTDFESRWSGGVNTDNITNLAGTTFTPQGNTTSVNGPAKLNYFLDGDQPTGDASFPGFEGLHGSIPVGEYTHKTTGYGHVSQNFTSTREGYNLAGGEVQKKEQQFEEVTKVAHSIAQAGRYSNTYDEHVQNLVFSKGVRLRIHSLGTGSDSSNKSNFEKLGWQNGKDGHGLPYPAVGDVFTCAPNHAGIYYSKAISAYIANNRQSFGTVGNITGMPYVTVVRPQSLLNSNIPTDSTILATGRLDVGTRKTASGGADFFPYTLAYHLYQSLGSTGAKTYQNDDGTRVGGFKYEGGGAGFRVGRIIYQTANNKPYKVSFDRHGAMSVDNPMTYSALIIKSSAPINAFAEWRLYVGSERGTADVSRDYQSRENGYITTTQPNAYDMRKTDSGALTLPRVEGNSAMQALSLFHKVAGNPIERPIIRYEYDFDKFGQPINEYVSIAEDELQLANDVRDDLTSNTSVFNRDFANFLHKRNSISDTMSGDIYGDNYFTGHKGFELQQARPNPYVSANDNFNVNNFDMKSPNGSYHMTYHSNKHHGTADTHQSFEGAVGRTRVGLHEPEGYFSPSYNAIQHIRKVIPSWHTTSRSNLTLSEQLSLNGKNALELDLVQNAATGIPDSGTIRINGGAGMDSVTKIYLHTTQHLGSTSSQVEVATGNIDYYLSQIAGNGQGFVDYIFRFEDSFWSTSSGDGNYDGGSAKNADGSFSKEDKYYQYKVTGSTSGFGYYELDVVPHVPNAAGFDNSSLKYTITTVTSTASYTKANTNRSVIVSFAADDAGMQNRSVVTDDRLSSELKISDNAQTTYPFKYTMLLDGVNSKAAYFHTRLNQGKTTEDDFNPVTGYGEKYFNTNFRFPVNYPVDDGGIAAYQLVDVPFDNLGFLYNGVTESLNSSIMDHAKIRSHNMPRIDVPFNINPNGIKISTSEFVIGAGSVSISWNAGYPYIASPGICILYSPKLESTNRSDYTEIVAVSRSNASQSSAEIADYANSVNHVESPKDLALTSNWYKLLIDQESPAYASYYRIPPMTYYCERPGSYIVTYIAQIRTGSQFMLEEMYFFTDNENTATSATRPTVTVESV
jgi:hypothetical protein